MTATFPDHLVASPGAVLEEWLDERRMSQREFADRTSKSEKFISQLINAKASLTADTAHDLELVTGVSADTWLRMEGSYRAMLRRRQAIDAAGAADSPVEAVLLKFLRDAGIVTAPARAKGEQVVQVFSLLGVSSTDGLARLTRRHSAAFRVSTSFTPDPVATEVMIALAQRQGVMIVRGSFDPEAMLANLPALRALTRSAPAQGALEARELLASAGVALVFLPNVPKAHCNGVTLWGPGGPVVAITDRGRREDIFWFTLFHELSHVLDGQRDAIYLEGPSGAEKPEAERRADEFATELLVPRAQEHLLAQIESFDDLALVARQLGVGEGVVIGQLHHRELKLPSWGQRRLAKVVVAGA
ncbi:ImmA/IrrE family metallo-endopeptidase [Demequina lutea]|uniref:HTH-type transcriptional regulator/antitoxin HigA n=1 Tax=Demequina lutea TaxID=431489 RepID=A0A7Y9ZCI3_9MICO|nr:ImmA/IrrE family metallo-endopeptidase [Demequina lutea]NYI42606.1 HTH-type transcriptional regulator/antitoxin HigA [Demequina lutea]